MGSYIILLGLLVLKHAELTLSNQLTNITNPSTNTNQFLSSTTASGLPSLSERANGVNSRYLYVANSASLAAGTVAAANAVSQAGSSLSNQNQLLHHGQQLTQQHQQPQNNQLNQQINLQPSQTALVTQGSISNSAQQVQTNIQSLPLPNQQQQTNSWNNNVQQARQSPIDQIQLAHQTPVHSSTFVTYQQPNSDQQQQQLGFSSFPGGLATSQSRPIHTSSSSNTYPFYGTQQRFNNGFIGSNNFERRVAGIRPSSSSVVYQNQLQHGHQQSTNQIQPVISNLLDIDEPLFPTLPNAINPNDLILPNNQQPQQQIFFGNSGLSSNNYQTSSSNQINDQHNQNLQQSLFASTTNNHVNGLIGSDYRPYHQDQCLAADNRHGTCYQASECIRRGGTPMGRCGASNASGNGGGPGEPYASAVCCIFDVTCGQFAAERFVYFRNPNYPAPTEQSRMCRAKIGKLDKSVCQLRLDLQRFDVAKPTNGNCSNDMFVVSGQNENYVIPKICGFNDGQHYYVGVDESGVITLHMMMMGPYYRRSFDILITQIPCRSDFAAPSHCLQYYVGTHGTIKSFNYEDANLGQDQLFGSESNLDSLNGLPNNNVGWPNSAPYGLQFNSNIHQQQQQARNRQHQFNSRYGNLLAAAAASSGYQPAFLQQSAFQQDHFAGYPNDLDYTMCIRKESGFCSITYQLSRSDNGQQQSFAIGGASWQNQQHHQSNEIGSGNQQWHQVSSECRDDYLLIGGVRLCSGNQHQQQLFSGTSIGDFNQANTGFINNTSSILGHNGSAGQQIQQLQSQHSLLMQQLARIQQQQQQQQQQSPLSNNSTSFQNGNLSSGTFQHQQPVANVNGNLNNNNNNQLNLDQQQGAILQQATLIQQQLQQLIGQQTSSGNRFQQQFDPLTSISEANSNIITDNTPGPFILRFVSNVARNARGFHIDYRQNPCK